MCYVKDCLPWRPQEVEDARGMGHLQRKATNRKWNPPKRKKGVTVNKAEEVEYLASILKLDMEIHDLEFVQLNFVLTLVQYFLSMLLSLCFGMVMYISCAIMYYRYAI